MVPMYVSVHPRGKPFSRHITDARGRKIETILLEGIGLFLRNNARGRKIEMVYQVKIPGWGLVCCVEKSYYLNDACVFK